MPGILAKVWGNTTNATDTVTTESVVGANGQCDMVSCIPPQGSATEESILLWRHELKYPFAACILYRRVRVYDTNDDFAEQLFSFLLFNDSLTVDMIQPYEVVVHV